MRNEVASGRDSLVPCHSFRPHRRDLQCSAAFTLIELLVVMSIIMILASMMLPSLHRAKEQARLLTCINNLHQIGISLRLYVDDHGDKFPSDHVYEPDLANTNIVARKSTLPALGGRDPIPELVKLFPTAPYRPLFPYLKLSEVFRCPWDKGQGKTPCPIPGIHPPIHDFKPSNWEAVGCSYQYNAGRLFTLAHGGLRQCPWDRFEAIAGQPENWVPSPALFILMHEPPARIYGCAFHGPEWHQWHYSRGVTDISDPVYARQQFISPVLFVDGHAGSYNFSKSLSTDPLFPYEPTKDWIWYKPAPPPPPKK